MIKFGTDGWRSLMSKDFNVENVEKVAQSIAIYLKENDLDKKGIFLGYDTRKNSDVFAFTCAKVLTANGIKAFSLLRAIPTPITAYTIKSMDLDGAIMITASHNPADYNGIKFIPFYGGPATPEITASIESNLENVVVKKQTTDGDYFIKVEPVEQYKKHLSDMLDVELLKKANLSILVNPMYGAAYGIAADILREQGCEVEEMNGEPDPDFGGITPEPIPKNLGSMIKRLKEEDYDLALAVDGDADRFGVFDKDATFIRANHALALIANYLVTVRKLKGAIVRSVATTHFLDVIAKKNNIEAIETPVGFKHIGQVMRERSVVLGAEESAGLSILGHIPEKDGILADLLLAEIVAYYKKPLSVILEELFEEYGRKFISKRLDLELAQEKKAALMSFLKNKPPKSIDGIKVVKTVDIDGMKFILEDGSWLLARPSGTEPIIRIYLETSDDKKLDKLERYAKSLTV